MSDTNAKGANTDQEQSFVTHLVELRNRLIYSIYGVVLVGVVLAIWPGPAGLIDIIAQPIRAHMPAGTKLIATGVFSPFFIPLKVLAMCAVLIALPWLLYQLWAFVAPGLYAHEKRLALPLIILGSVLAFTGVAFVHFYVLDKMFLFIQKFTPSSVAATPDIASYVESLISLYIAFATAFQVPVVVMLLVRFNMVTIEKLKAFRGYFIVLAFVIAAVLTPPDAVSQLALAVPMVILYEFGIFASRFYVKASQAPADETTQAKSEQG